MTDITDLRKMYFEDGKNITQVQKKVVGQKNVA